MNNEDAIFYLLNSNEYHHAKGDLPHSAASVEAFNKAIAALRSERPKGKWERIPDDTNPQRVVYKCSVCGRIIDTYYREDLAFSYPFCHCGADMRDGEQRAPQEEYNHMNWDESSSEQEESEQSGDKPSNNVCDFNDGIFDPAYINDEVDCSDLGIYPWGNS